MNIDSNLKKVLAEDRLGEHYPNLRTFTRDSRKKTQKERDPRVVMSERVLFFHLKNFY